MPSNLPADLPENWQLGQIVAPSGEDVGLPRQYGYNYLMQQINLTQQAVNTLETSGTATEEEINTLKTSLQALQSQLAAVKATAKAALPQSGGAMTGTLSDPLTAQVRNISAGTADLAAGTSDLASGAVYLMYE